MAKDDFIKELTSIKGIGKARAEDLFKNGYDSMEKLKKASVKDLTKIKGINENVAKDLLNQLKEKPKEKTTKPTAKPKPKSETKKKVEKPEKKPVKETKKTAKKPKKKEEKEEVEIVKEEKEKEGEYKVKKKPELTPVIKEKLKIRKKIKNRTPNFYREEWFRYKRLGKSWRKPDGISSKMRRNFKYRPKMVRVGFRGPKETRGYHPSGFQEVIVYNVNDLEKINPKTQAARIGGSIGTKKREDIQKKAEELDIRVLNL